MCRSLSEGGRRCPCGQGERRRAYQRARYALKQAENAAGGVMLLSAADGVPGVPGANHQSPAQTTPIFKGVRPTSVSGSPTLSHMSPSQAAARTQKLSELVSNGTIAKVLSGFPASEQRRVQGLSAVQMAQELAAERDTLALGETLHCVDASSTFADRKIAERVTNFVGEMSLAWVNGRTRNEEAAVQSLIDAYDNIPNPTATDIQKYAPMIEKAADDLGRARHAAFKQLISAVFGKPRALTSPVYTSPELDGWISSANALVADVIPNPMKDNMDRLGGLEIHVMDSGRGAYSVDITGPLPSVSYEPHTSGTAAVDAVATHATQRVVPVNIDGTKVYFPYLGGNAFDFDAEMNLAQALDYVNAQMKTQAKNGGYLVFTRRVTGDGRLSAECHVATEKLVTPQTNAIFVARGDSSVLLHEYGHRVQHAHPYLQVVESWNIFDRCGPEAYSSPIPYFGDPNELVRPDEFVDHYSGKVYSFGTELFTTGLEALFSSKRGAGVGAGFAANQHANKDMNTLRLRPDPRLLTITAGILMSAPKK